MLGPEPRAAEGADSTCTRSASTSTTCCAPKRAPGVSIERDYDPSLPNAMLDRHQMIQALLNVARNALQAHGRPRHASCCARARAPTSASARRGTGWWRACRSRTTARACRRELRSSIFYPLVTGRANGTGLGLAVAQELVTRNGGLIEFESEPGRTVFTLLLPLGEAA